MELKLLIAFLSMAVSVLMFAITYMYSQPIKQVVYSIKECVQEIKTTINEMRDNAQNLRTDIDRLKDHEKTIWKAIEALKQQHEALERELKEHQKGSDGQ